MSRIGPYLGGAKSHDVEDEILNPADPNFHAKQSTLKRSGRNRFRVLGRSWWPEGLPSDEKHLTALETPDQASWRAYHVITHCASTSIVLAMNRHNEAGPLTDFLEMIDRRLEYEYWFFDHFHDNRSGSKLCRFCEKGQRRKGGTDAAFSSLALHFGKDRSRNFRTDVL